MRFEMKVDLWIGIAVSLAAIATFLLPLIYICREAIRHKMPSPIAMVVIAIWVIALLATLPQYYVLEEQDILIRQGWHRSVVPYREIVSIQSVHSSLSSAVFSADRVIITTSKGNAYVVAPRERSRFLDLLSLRTALPGAQPTH